MAGGMSRSLAVLWGLSVFVAAIGGATVATLSSTTQSAGPTEKQVANLRSSLAAGNRTISNLQQEVTQQQNKLTELRSMIRADHSRISQLRAQLSALPHTTISDGNVTWSFADLGGQDLTWTLPMTSYENYAKMTRPTTEVYLSTGQGTINSLDARPYITPAFFKNVIGSLTKGHTAEEFVREAFNVKAQLVTYNNTTWDNLGTDQYPAETLTQGIGICRDMSILFASLLIAGNDQANYNLTVRIIYADAKLEDGSIAPGGDPFVQNATGINHMFVEVDYANGSRQFIETTATRWFTYSGYWGWSLKVPDDGNFEQTAAP